jgi:CRISPR-associated endonuclease/helicase Cas3
MNKKQSETCFLMLREALGLPNSMSPFPWQNRLLEKFLAGDFPSALDIPTGLGKTAVMTIWLVARAAGAPVPRRLVYVVDRRAVVDQATDVALNLRKVVDQEPTLKQSLGLVHALPISTLRGQFVDNREWLEDPSLPAIVVGTVDMIGSRLLFSGYGVSQKMRPYHAGFLGADSLIVLDEAHLVQPFERMLEQVAKGKDANGRILWPEAEFEALVPKLRVLSLSATGRARTGEDVFRLDEKDWKHPVVQKRLGASKRAILKPAISETDLPSALADQAWVLSQGGVASARIIVFCNSRDCAQKVQENLEARGPKSGPKPDTELFVGGRRVHERNLVAKWLSERGFIAGEKVELERPSFVIATSAGEVGVDLDADHAVCDLVAWERMVQRLGRVNRRGEGKAKIVVIPQELDKDGNVSCRESLLRLFETLPPVEDGEGVDVSPGALVTLKERPDLQELIHTASTPARLHPPLTRALIESWSMTSLEEHTGRPDVEPWIRGWLNPDEADEPQTTVVWREELPLKVDGDTKMVRLLEGKDLEAFRDAADPHTAEKLETETRRVLDWLVKRVEKIDSAKGKSAGSEESENSRHERPLSSEDIVAVVLDFKGGSERTLKGKEISENRKQLERTLANSTLIVDCRLGGLRRGLLAKEEDVYAEDVTTLGGDDYDSQLGSRTDLKTVREIPFQVRRISSDQARKSAKGWRTEAAIPAEKVGDEITVWLVIESLVSQAAGSEEGRSGSLCNQLLDVHEEWAESDARAIAAQLALPPEYAEMLAVAARLHDEGKKAACWQQAFNAPNGGSPPYAKTKGRPRFSILGRYRHELGSLPYAEAHARVQALAPELRELCLRMIVAHHGYARPLIRIEGAAEPPSRLKKRAQEIALGFSALEKRWGPWGLAWWESLLRAADQKASRRNDEEGGTHG